MEFKANVTLCDKPGTLKGFASVTIDEQFAINGIRIVEGEYGPFLSMPSKKVGEDYEDICFPVTKECRDKLHEAVINAYKEKLSQQEGYNVSENTVTCNAIAYTDGSYSESDGRYAYGVVLFIGDQKLTFSKAFESSTLSQMRNVAGEIAGAEFVMEYCVTHGIPALEIRYDYEGVEKWCTGEWKTKKEGTKAYKSYYDSVKNKLKVTFTKVKGHSGDKYNDEADQLAKDALGIK